MILTKLGVVRVSTDDTAGAAQVIFRSFQSCFDQAIDCLCPKCKNVRGQMVAASGERDSGVIASDRAADIYGLNILLEKIQARLLL